MRPIQFSFYFWDFSKHTYHPSLFPAVGLLLEDVEVALPGDDGAHPDLLAFRHV
jgi:hypothetical protein